MKVTAQQLKIIMPKCNTDQWLNALNQAMMIYGQNAVFIFHTNRNYF